MKRRGQFLFSLALIAALLWGCGGQQADSSSVASSPAATPAPTAAPTQQATQAPASSEETATATPQPSPPPEQEADADETVAARSGNSMEDAILIPAETKIYGTVRDGAPVWYAFTAGEDADAQYYVFLVVKTPGGQGIQLTGFDADGARRTSKNAYADGLAVARDIPLAPQEVCYLQLQGNDSGAADYMLVVRDKAPRPASEAVSLSSNLSEARGASAVWEGAPQPGGNMDDAQIVPFDLPIAGSVAGQEVQWYAFSLGDDYNDVDITLECATPGATVRLTPYNEYGSHPAGWANATGDAGSDTVTFGRSHLAANSIFYIAVESPQGETAAYTFQLHMELPQTTVPETPGGPDTGADEPLVFEMPFELNETQIMFVANQAVFVNEAEARAALAPLAEVILAHPGHPVLIAGTTATSGKQSSCERLSQKRADAVKALLVEGFGVPENQLLTIGLGYQRDPFLRGKDRDARGGFVETEGAKNRRVVIMDARDPVAQTLLGG